MARTLREQKNIDSVFENKIGKEKRRSLIIDLLITAVITYIVFGLIFRPGHISGISMEPTLHDGDYGLFFRLGGYKEEDIVMFHTDSGDVLIKRIIATAGDTVDINESGYVFVNGVALEEDYIYEPTYPRDQGTSFPITVTEGSVFVLGDNRDKAKDSRSWDLGLVETKEIIGKLLFILRLKV